MFKRQGNSLKAGAMPASRYIIIVYHTASSRGRSVYRRVCDDDYMDAVYDLESMLTDAPAFIQKEEKEDGKDNG